MSVKKALEFFPTATELERKALSEACFQDVLSKKTNLHEFITALGPLLTSTDVNTRVQGMELMTAVMIFTRKSHLSQVEVELVFQFYVDRLIDSQSCKPCLQGICHMLQYFKLEPENINFLVTRIFAEVNAQSLRQPQRALIFKVFKLLLTLYLKDVIAIGNDFVFGFIQAMDGEKDPRNLLPLFEMGAIIISNFDISRFTEDMFEIAWCYFPITYSPPPTDKSGITRADLRDGLNFFLKAEPQFAQFCLPNLVEKLSSNIAETKIETYTTLEICAETYRVELSNFMPEIWECMKIEIFDYREESMVNTVLKTLKKCLMVLHAEDCDALIDIIVKDCKMKMKPGSDTWSSIGRLLASLCAAKENGAKRVLTELFPFYLEELEKLHSDDRYKHALLEGAVNIYRSCKDLLQKGEYEFEYLQRFEDSLCLLVSEEAPSIRSLSIFGFVSVVSFASLSQEKMKKLISNTLLPNILSETDGNVRMAILASFGSWILEAETILLELLPRIYEFVSDGTAECLDWYLEILCAFGVSSILSRNIAPTLIDIISVPTYAFKTQVCVCLNNIVIALNDFPNNVVSITESDRKVTGHTSVTTEEKNNKKIVFNEISSLLSESFLNFQTCWENTETLTSFSRLLVNVTRLSETSGQEILYSTFIRFINGPEVNFQYGIILSASVFCNLRKEVTIKNYEFLQTVLDVALSDEYHLEQKLEAMRVRSANLILASVLNSRVNDSEDCQRFLNKSMEKLQSIFSDATKSDNETISALTSWSHICKGLAVAGNMKHKDFIKLLIDQLSSKKNGSTASEGFGIVIQETDECLNKFSHSKLKFMYRQRLFHENVNTIKELYHSSDEGVKVNYLTAISYLLCSLPEQVLVNEVPALFPLLLDSLDFGSLNVKTKTLDTMTVLMTSSPVIFSKKVDLLITCLLKLLNSPYMIIRRGVLDCIMKLSKLPYHEIHPHKQTIIDALEIMLDDKKRLVRQDAVKCRGIWYQL